MLNVNFHMLNFCTSIFIFEMIVFNMSILKREALIK